MRKSKEILEKLERIEYLLEKPAKYKIGDKVFYSIGEYNECIKEPELLIEVEILNMELGSCYWYYWEYLIKLGGEDVWISYGFYTKDEISKFKTTKIQIIPQNLEPIKVSEYLKAQKFD